MTKYIITLFIIFIGQTKLFSQNPEKVTIDSTHYYYKLVPKSKPVGTIIILHGGSEDAKGVMNQITLDEIALKNNFVVIFPNIEDDDFKMTVSQKILDTIAKQIVDKHKV
jgi:poly(3-hydroxybutyrate) depolymerase